MLCLVYSIWLLTMKSESTNEARNSQWRNNENHWYFPRVFLFLNHISGFLHNSHIQIAASSGKTVTLKNIFPYFLSKFSFVSIPFQLGLWLIFFICKIQIGLLTGLSPKRKRIQQQNTFPYYWNRNDFSGPLPSILAIKAVPGIYLTFDRIGFREQKTIFKIKKSLSLSESGLTTHS